MSYDQIANLMINEISKAATEQYAYGGHLVTDHAMVGDLPGLIRGSVDWMMNQGALSLYLALYHICIFYTSAYTFWLNDEGVGFY